MRTIDYSAALESMYLDMMEEMYKHLSANSFTWPTDIPFDEKEERIVLAFDVVPKEIPSNSATQILE